MDDIDKAAWVIEAEREQVAPEALSWALKFLAALPSWAADPDVCVDPDKWLAFDWRPERDRMVTLSVCPRNGNLVYAWLCPGGKGHGLVPFDGTEVPHELRQILFRVLDPGGEPVEENP